MYVIFLINLNSWTLTHSVLDGHITAADILSDPIPKKKRKKEDPKEELREELKTVKPEEIENVDVSGY